jgi:hypothetical protein
MVTIMGWELQNPFMMWCWRKPKLLSKDKKQKQMEAFFFGNIYQHQFLIIQP